MSPMCRVAQVKIDPAGIFIRLDICPNLKRHNPYSFDELHVYVWKLCMCCACAVHVLCMCCACAVHVLCMCCACAVHVLCMCCACAVHVLCMCCACAVHVLCMCCACVCMCCACAVHVLCMCCACAVHVLCMCVHVLCMCCACAVHVLCMCCACAVHVRVCVQVLHPHMHTHACTPYDVDPTHILVTNDTPHTLQGGVGVILAVMFSGTGVP